MFYGYFPFIPLILVITRQNGKTLFYVFLSFRNLPELKLTQNFWSVGNNKLQSLCINFACINIPKLNPCSSTSMKVIKLNKNFGVYYFYENDK
jgi:hypothetical protein